MITLFMIILFFAFLFSLMFIGLWFFGGVLFVIGGCNLWKTKWLEPTDYQDEEHMERVRQRMKNKAIIQMVIGFILFILFVM